MNASRPNLHYPLDGIALRACKLLGNLPKQGSEDRTGGNQLS